MGPTLYVMASNRFAVAWAAMAVVGLSAGTSGGCAWLIGADWDDYRPADDGIAAASCDDRIQNGEETDVDCGGDCSPCTLAKLCLDGTDCYAGNCADGVCCNAACDADCDACTAALKESGDADGTCGPAKAETACGEATCSEGVETSRRTCDGESVECAPGEEKECKEFACDPEADACFTECTEDAHCAKCHECDAGGACVLAAAGAQGLGCDEGQACDADGACKPANGERCVEHSECANGLCIDGVCCNVACNATCMACNVEGSEGTCSNVPLGNEDGTDCSEANVCDGKGACKLAAGEDCTTNEQCASDKCLPTVFTCDHILTP